MALISKKVMNFAYGMGAAVVIVGALFKIQHWTGGSELLVVGLLTEAFIFALSAFDNSDEELDWTLVYPELAGGEAKQKSKKTADASDADGLLSQKLDTMLKEAKIDGELMASLGNSIKNFESAAKGIAPTVDSLASTRKYSEELTKAAAQMESLNNLYKLQLESASVNAEANKDIAENAAMLKQQMQSMTANIASLNAVYGGMLSAMSNKG
ncbi:gliding motility protein GldL [Flavobacterium sp.]|uniref:type IX secretion system motor protein PorL/GldL n=1 Tax=Flavobacterium sp. TaxID=239 RepID=UPI0008C27C52|nr:gliding motility protein GldL [Flavobacterium sp.]OGS65179.1 MAG: gliding motility protein GldL [Flavobacteria bacterium GWA2_35_26]HCF03215.1 gliding motility protein GldL [Flavobacterium sp.]